MRKLLYFFVILFTVVFMSNCENEPLETENTPENLFADKTWEYRSTSESKLYLYVLSFTDDEFTYYHKHEAINKEVTYTGTYRLYNVYEVENGFTYLAEVRIEFVSAEPTWNGSAQYSFSMEGYYQEGGVIFFNRNGLTGLDSVKFMLVN